MIDELLEKISKLATKSETSESEVDHLMTLIRKLKERTSDKSSDYPLLDLFCDWTKHVSLDRNALGQKVIIELNEKLFQLKNTKGNDIFIDGISQIISFERLQSELSNFLTNYKIPLNIVKDKKLWLRYITNLVNIVSDCELQLPVNRRGQVKNSIKDGVVAISMKYTWLEENVFTNKMNTKKVLSLIIRLSDTTTLVLPSKILGKYLTYEKATE